MTVPPKTKSKEALSYYPFGSLLRSGGTPNRFGYQGEFAEDETEETGYNSFELRQYDPVVGRWLSTDPYGQYASPYLGMGNNPVNGVDPDGGKFFSTEIDASGNVVNVQKDDDLNVYRVDADGNRTGEIIGQTRHWDEFLAGGRIIVGTSWDEIIEFQHQESRGMNLLEIKDESKRFQKFDIKESADLSPYGVNTGRLLYGKYATARSAGNFEAGYNASRGSLWGISITFTTYMKLAGSYHKHGELTKGAIYNIICEGGACGPKPYYGEIPYAGRMIEMGWKYGKHGQIK